MGLFRPSGDDALGDAADGRAVSTNDLKAIGPLGGLMGAMGGLSQLGPAVDTIAAAFLAQAEQLAAIARSVHRAEAQRKVLAFPTSGSSVVLPENDWQTLVVANAGTTDISVSLDGDPLTWPVASGAPGLPTLVALPLAGVRQVTVTGQTQPVYAIATTQVGSVDVLLPGAAQDGTDATGANAGTQATSGVGIRGWLSTLVGLFQSVGAKVQGLGIAGTPEGGVMSVQGGGPTATPIPMQDMTDLISSVVATITVGANPFGVGYAVAQNLIYVANNSSGTVSVINPATNAVVATITVGATPYGIGYAATQNLIYVANSGAGTVSVINPATNAVVNRDFTLIASAAHTASVTTADQANHTWRGVNLIIDVTGVSGTAPTLVVALRGKDPTSNKYYTILASATISTVSTTVLSVYPGLTAAANSVANAVLPRTWDVVATIGGTTPSFTMSIGASVLL